MKIIISLPKSVFRSANRLAARLGISPSGLYFRAIGELLARREAANVTDRLNAIYGSPGAAEGLDPNLAVLQATSVARVPPGIVY